ncbi:hypothetical protein [Campylobacter lanienae]|uniref:hypothetical protein n=1 Tax=Campylobacter lanienae TaxID=75658 RepID=UPI0015D8B741|nr:hypothetical protein [Campylobacter lanienae]
MSNSAAKFHRQIPPQYSNSTTAPKNPTHKNSPPNHKTLHKKPNLTPQKPNFISIHTKSD